MKKRGLSNGSDGRESICNVGDPGSIPGWERSSAEGNGKPLQKFCLGNPMDKGAWQTSSLGHRVRHDLLTLSLFTPKKKCGRLKRNLYQCGNTLGNWFL